eukprot:3191033-Rhodomonas_salina.1
MSGIAGDADHVGGVASLQVSTNRSGEGSEEESRAGVQAAGGKGTQWACTICWNQLQVRGLRNIMLFVPSCVALCAWQVVCVEVNQAGECKRCRQPFKPIEVTALCPLCSMSSLLHLLILSHPLSPSLIPSPKLPFHLLTPLLCPSSSKGRHQKATGKQKQCNMLDLGLQLPGSD